MHKVTVTHEVPKTRAVCVCGWRSPWVTETVVPDVDGVPPRPAIQDRAVRAGEWHIRFVAGGHK